MRQDAQGQRARRDRQHEGWSSNAFEIAHAQMRHNRAHKVEDEADCRRDTQPRQSDPSHQSQCASKLTAG